MGRQVKTLLTSIPISGPFDRVTVDVLQLPLLRQGNCYAVEVMNYLIKWPEVFTVLDQSDSPNHSTVVRGEDHQSAWCPISVAVGPWGCLPFQFGSGVVHSDGNKEGQHYSIPSSDRWVS